MPDYGNRDRAGHGNLEAFTRRIALHRAAPCRRGDHAVDNVIGHPRRSIEETASSSEGLDQREPGIAVDGGVILWGSAIILSISAIQSACPRAMRYSRAIAPRPGCAGSAPWRPSARPRSCAALCCSEGCARVRAACRWLCHRTLTARQNYYTKVSKIRMPVLAMATSSSQGGTRCVLKTPYLMQQQSLQQAY